jgi:hypothetical protein
MNSSALPEFRLPSQQQVYQTEVYRRISIIVGYFRRFLVSKEIDHEISI